MCVSVLTASGTRRCIATRNGLLQKIQDPRGDRKRLA
jgi:hypothetical protein